jgi:hypothetical protein
MGFVFRIYRAMIFFNKIVTNGSGFYTFAVGHHFYTFGHKLLAIGHFRIDCQRNSCILNDGDNSVGNKILRK